MVAKNPQIRTAGGLLTIDVHPRVRKCFFIRNGGR
jgi:hypothetical protein